MLEQILYRLSKLLELFRISRVCLKFVWEERGYGVWFGFAGRILSTGVYHVRAVFECRWLSFPFSFCNWPVWSRHVTWLAASNPRYWSSFAYLGIPGWKEELLRFGGQVKPREGHHLHVTKNTKAIRNRGTSWSNGPLGPGLWAEARVPRRHYCVGDPRSHVFTGLKSIELREPKVPPLHQHHVHCGPWGRVHWGGSWLAWVMPWFTGLQEFRLGQSHEHEAGWKPVPLGWRLFWVTLHTHAVQIMVALVTQRKALQLQSHLNAHGARESVLLATLFNLFF